MILATAMAIFNYSISTKDDWLVRKPSQIAMVKKDGDRLILENGLVRRVFATKPNGATLSIDNLMTGESMLRAIKPSSRFTIDGKSFDVGGLVGQRDQAYLDPSWIPELKADSKSLQYKGFSVGELKPRMEWKHTRYAGNLEWPPKGVELTLQFEGSGFQVKEHYECYDGIPLISKRLTILNATKDAVVLDGITTEILAFVEGESVVVPMKTWRFPDIHIESDYEFGGDVPVNANKTTNWVTDATFTSQINYELKTPAVMESRMPLGPTKIIQPGDSFETFTTFELFYDSTERERNGLAVRKMYRTVAPWCTENPIMMHLTSTDPEIVHRAIDQCAQVGFEMVILSFGSGLDMEDVSDANIAKYKGFADYAHSKGIQLGGYSLLASRRINDDEDVINPATGKTGGAIFGNSPCLGSNWGIKYFEHVKTFLEKTGFDLLEHDGSYPGDPCASTTHPGHRGLEDSQYNQWKIISEFYRWCRSKGIYLNVPDWYYLAGSNKSAMGYREVNWSLPRLLQIVIGRQNLHDGTWQKTPSMGWMFVPLTEYQGGGAEATIEPLRQHLDAYEAHLANNFGYGVQACYRGPRLFDSPETRDMVKRWVDFYKKHRQILDSDVIHIRRADSRELDAVMHVDPEGKEKGLVMLYNPTDKAIKQEFSLPLYYTGLTEKAKVSISDGAPMSVKLDRAYKASVPVEVPAHSRIWIVIE